MATFLIAISLLILFLILDRVHNILRHRREIARAERDAALSVLKIVIKQELLRLKDPGANEPLDYPPFGNARLPDVKQNILTKKAATISPALKKDGKC